VELEISRVGIDIDVGPLVLVDNVALVRVAPGESDSPTGLSTLPSPFWSLRVESLFEMVGDEADAFDSVEGPPGVEGGTIPENEVRPTEDPDPGLELWYPPMLVLLPCVW
jgi:hypothetical protein